MLNLVWQSGYVDSSPVEMLALNLEARFLDLGWSQEGVQ